MSIFKKSIVVASVLAFLGIGVFSCEQEGPAERAGKKIDESAEQAKEKVDELKEKSGEKLEEVGEKMQ